MKALAAHRRNPLVLLFALLVALGATGGIYTALAPRDAAAETVSAADVQAGEQLFLANCATCHGTGATGTEAGPSLIGVGAAAVDFQVSSGRMPMQMDGPQAERKPAQFGAEETAQMAAYVATLGPGPAIPTDEQVDPANGDPAAGATLFRTNCAMCHNAAGSGGALSQGKWAPPLTTPEVTDQQIYTAMQTGPQNMPVFNSANVTPQEKTDIIAYLDYTERTSSVGGIFSLGGLGPVTEGLFVWTVGLALLLSVAVWLGVRSR